MLRFDLENADLLAAKVVREAISTTPDRTWNTIEAAIADLYSEDRIDSATLRHVLKYLHRFEFRGPPVFFDAVWHVIGKGRRDGTKPKHSTEEGAKAHVDPRIAAQGRFTDFREARVAGALALVDREQKFFAVLPKNYAIRRDPSGQYAIVNTDTGHQHALFWDFIPMGAKVALVREKVEVQTTG